MEHSTEEYRTALHEAAHVIIALELGVPVENATIEPCGSTEGRVKYGEATAEQKAMITMAGPMADAIAGVEYDMDWAREGDEVWEHLLEVVKEQGKLDPEDRAELRLQVKALHKELAREVRKMLIKRWTSILALAEALISHRRLDGKAIDRILYQRA